MNDEDLERLLVGNLSRINEWLRFAETKNAALLTFCSAWLVAMCSLWANNTAPAIIQWAMTAASPFIIAAALCSLASLLPVSQRKVPGQTARELSTKNILFHGNIAHLDLATAGQAFQTRYGSSATDQGMKNHIIDLITQLVETSQVTTRKFSLFTSGARLVLVAIIAALLSAALRAVIHV